jgi:cytochrome P450
MGAFLNQIDALQPEDRWAAVRGLVENQPAPFMNELRRERPILVLPEVTLVSTLADCMTVLRRHGTFGVDLYAPKQGGYFMAQDDTAEHWREKSVMKAVLDRDELPEIRRWIGEETAAILAGAQGRFDLVRTVTRGVPVRLVQEWFGFTRSDPDKLIDWSYWNQQDAFWNQPFDRDRPGIDPQGIVANRRRALFMMALYVGRLVVRTRLAVALGSDAKDPVTRLVRLAASDSVRFSLRDTLFNVGGLLIGAVETTSHAVVNALMELLSRPDQLRSARDAARVTDSTAFDGHVFEALRFRPAFSYFFRVCHRDTWLGGSSAPQVIPAGKTVIALTKVAMRDPAGFPDPDTFNPDRDLSDSFTFGQGLHSCLGEHIARVMVPEIVRQILLQEDLDFGTGANFGAGTVPQEWHISSEVSAE